MKLEYLHRIDPNMDAAAAQRIIDSAVADLPRLRPKARTAKEALIQAMQRDLAKIQASA